MQQNDTNVNTPRVELPFDPTQFFIPPENKPSAETPIVVAGNDDTESTNYLLMQGSHDEGNAQCVNKHHKGKFAYNDALGWLAHNGAYWATDGAEAILDRAVVETLNARMRAALDSGESERYEKLIRASIPTAILKSE